MNKLSTVFKRLSFILFIIFSLVLSLISVSSAQSPLTPFSQLNSQSRGQTPNQAHSQAHTIGILADFNSSYGSTDYDPLVHKAVDVMIKDWQVDLVFMPGDVIAGQSYKLADNNFAAMWQGFDNAIATPLRDAGIPYVFSVGNHDGSSQSSNSGSNASFHYERERKAAKSYWSAGFAPLSYINAENYPFQYSIIFKDLFIISLDASSNRLLFGSEQWLREQLSTPQAQNAKHRIVLGHLPFYGVAQGKTKAGEVLADGNVIAKLLQENNVDVYISGHHAAYYPATSNQLTLIHTGGIMGRKLIGSEETAKHTIIKLGIEHDGTLTIDGFDLKTLGFIDKNTLPTYIKGIGGTSYLKQ